MADNTLELIKKVMDEQEMNYNILSLGGYQVMSTYFGLKTGLHLHITAIPQGEYNWVKIRTAGFVNGVPEEKKVPCWH